MSNDCICKNPTRRLLNTHMDKRKIELIILGKGIDKGIVILEQGLAIATFDINYCPVCGEELYKERCCIDCGKVFNCTHGNQIRCDICKKEYHKNFMRQKRAKG